MLLFVTAVMVVLVVSFLCSIFESVLLSLTRPQIEVISKQRDRVGSLLAGFKEKMDVPIAAILILNTAAHTVGAAVAGASYAEAFNENTLWLFTILFTAAVLLFTEIIPKTLGVSYTTALAAPVAHGVRWLTVMLRPLVLLSEKISSSLRRDTETPVTSVEEIRVLAALGRREGVVGARTAGMIRGATDLDQVQADDVMLPRDNIRFLSAEMGRDEAVALMKKSGHSRFPFSPTRDVDDVTGIVLAKTLLHWLLTNDAPDIDWDAVRYDALVVPESVTLIKLLRIFQETHRHLAIVVDEFGDVQGIVTMEDVLEEVVGDIRDESDRQANDIVEMVDGSLLVKGDVDLRKLCSRLGVSWDPHGEAATIGGLVVETLERIPRSGHTLDWNGYRIEVVRADRRRIRLLSIQTKNEEE